MPDTPAARLAQGYFRAFNSGSAERMRTFIETFLVADANRSTDDRVQSFTRTFADLGPLAVTTVDASELYVLSLGVGTRQGALRLTVRASPDQPDRAVSITLASTRGGHP
jgi:hypothetical protein